MTTVIPQALRATTGIGIQMLPKKFPVRFPWIDRKNASSKLFFYFIRLFGAPGEIRTPDPLVRSEAFARFPPGKCVSLAAKGMPLRGRSRGRVGPNSVSLARSGTSRGAPRWNSEGHSFLRPGGRTPPLASTIRTRSI